MTKYQKVTVSLAVLTLILTSGITSAYAYAGEYKKSNKNTSVIQEKRSSILESFEKKDYQAWLEIVGKDSLIASIIDEEKFVKFVEARTLAREGDYDGALKLSQDLGIDLEQELLFIISDLGFDDKNPEVNITEVLSQARSALDKNDYSLWREAIKELKPINAVINEENFVLLVEAHKLMQSEKFEGARNIRQKIGLRI